MPPATTCKLQQSMVQLALQIDSAAPEHCSEGRGICSVHPPIAVGTKGRLRVQAPHQPIQGAAADGSLHSDSKWRDQQPSLAGRRSSRPEEASSRPEEHRSRPEEHRNLLEERSSRPGERSSRPEERSSSSVAAPTAVGGPVRRGADGSWQDERCEGEGQWANTM